MKKLILASSSPRRQQILKDLGLDFEIILPFHFEEIMDGVSPEDLVCKNAIGKAREVATHCKDSKSIIIGSDTVIAFKEEILGKPKSAENAKAMLTKLSGEYHNVFSGLAVIDTSTWKELVGYEETKVKFRKLSSKEIDDYITTGEPLDKAGAYGIQARGELFVERIEGSFSNVVGLPKGLLIKYLEEIGLMI